MFMYFFVESRIAEFVNVLSVFSASAASDQFKNFTEHVLFFVRRAPAIESPLLFQRAGGSLNFEVKPYLCTLISCLQKLSTSSPSHRTSNGLVASVSRSPYLMTTSRMLHRRLDSKWSTAGQSTYPSPCNDYYVLLTIGLIFRSLKSRTIRNQ